MLASRKSLIVIKFIGSTSDLPAGTPSSCQEDPQTLPEREHMVVGKLVGHTFRFLLCWLLWNVMGRGGRGGGGGGGGGGDSHPLLAPQGAPGGLGF